MKMNDNGPPWCGAAYGRRRAGTVPFQGIKTNHYGTLVISGVLGSYSNIQYGNHRGLI
jgi:hypothetical protein